MVRISVNKILRTCLVRLQLSFILFGVPMDQRFVGVVWRGSEGPYLTFPDIHFMIFHEYVPRMN